MRDFSPQLAHLAEAPPAPDEAGDLERCDALRARLERSDRDIGDVFEAEGRGVRTTVGAETRSASVPKAKALLIYRLVRALRPERTVEMGSALGVSGAHLASALRANGTGRLLTIEGSPSRHAVAAESIESVAPGVTDAVLGMFDDHLERLRGADLIFVDGNHQPGPVRAYVDAAVASAARPAVLVLDDMVGWSPELTAVWRELARDERFAATGETEGMGALVLGPLDERLEALLGGPGLEPRPAAPVPGLLARLRRRLRRLRRPA